MLPVSMIRLPYKHMINQIMTSLVSRVAPVSLMVQVSLVAPVSLGWVFGFWNLKPLDDVTQIRLHGWHTVYKQYLYSRHTHSLRASHSQTIPHAPPICCFEFDREKHRISKQKLQLWKDRQNGFGNFKFFKKPKNGIFIYFSQWFAAAKIF